MLFSCSCASHKFGQFRELGLQLAVRGGQGNGKLSMKSYRTVNYQWRGKSHGKSHRNWQLSALIMRYEKWRRANSVGSITSSYSKKVKKVQVCLHCRCFSPSGEPLLLNSLSFSCLPPSDVTLLQMFLPPSGVSASVGNSICYENIYLGISILIPFLIPFCLSHFMRNQNGIKKEF